MILETIVIFLALLLLYHLYVSITKGQDFLGELGAAIYHQVRYGFNNPSPATWDWGIPLRKLQSGSNRLATYFDVVGPKVTNGIGSNEFTPPVGIPVGLPSTQSPTSPTATATTSTIPGQPEQQPLFNLQAANEFLSPSSGSIFD